MSPQVPDELPPNLDSPEATDPAPGRTRLVVIFGGQSAEHDVSCITARHVLEAADPGRFEVVPVGITRAGEWVLATEAIAALKAGDGRSLPRQIEAEGPHVEPLPTLRAEENQAGDTVVMPLLHGPMGEDGTVQGMLELADLPYVGSGVLASALAMDKVMAKQVMGVAGLAQPRYEGVRDGDAGPRFRARVAARFGFPMFVKPANMGSSIGVSKAIDDDSLSSALELALSYDEWALVEEAIVGREIEVAILGNDEPRVSVPGEIRPAADFYDYDDKYFDGRAELLVPAPLDPTQSREVQALAVTAFRSLRCSGMARIDFFLEDRRGFLVNEVNTIPGFTPISMYPRLWEATGIGYSALIAELARLALERHGERHKHRRTTRS